MAELSFIEKRTIEKFLEMESGYVLDFSNRTMQEFLIDSMGIDIYDDKYDYSSGSKANRVRGFLRVESNYNAGVLIEKLCEYWISQIHTGDRDYDQSDENRYKECLKIAQRLKSDGPVENIDSLKPNSDDQDFSKLSKSIRDSIEKNQPEAALDRLHTFVVKYVRELCSKHEIEFEQNHPLHSLFGAYVKHLTGNELIESVMTERILKSSISVLEAFNDVRNNKSFAHDNTILNYNESILIFNDVSNVIRFIESIESERSIEFEASKNIEMDDDLPF